MTLFKNAFLSTIAALGFLTSSAAAQSFTGTETAYASVRGWDVIAISDQYGTFTSCGAVKWEGGQPVMVAQGTDGTWIISTPTRQTGTFGGGVIDIDNASIDSQFGFIGGFAVRDLSISELELIKAGNQLGIMVNGDGPESWWSLAGSTAAILKATECVQRGGQVAAYTPAPSPSPSPSDSSLLVPTIPVGETRIGDCQMGFTAVYRCNWEGLPPKGGYISSTRVTDVFNEAPTIDLDAVSATEADVWADMGNGWLFMGRWEANFSYGNCLTPAPNQSQEAFDNIGQDAWEICLK